MSFKNALIVTVGIMRLASLTAGINLRNYFFGQLTNRNGLRDLCLKAHNNHLYHLGIKQSVNQSSLSRANENRDWRIFRDFGLSLIDVVTPLYLNEPSAVTGVDKDIFAIDSTAISVSINLVDWARGKYSKGNELFTENKINQKIKEQPNLFNNSEL
jgi:hypothetical protein